jgi:hypothetical protein
VYNPLTPESLNSGSRRDGLYNTILWHVDPLLGNDSVDNSREGIHCWATDVFSVLWSYPSLYNDKQTIIYSSLHKALLRNMLALPGSLRQTAIYWNCSACKTKFSAPLEIFQGAHRFAFCTWLPNFCTYMIIQQNYAGNKHKSYKIMKMQMFATLDKANPDTGNIRGLNLASVKHMTIQVTRLLL